MESDLKKRTEEWKQLERKTLEQRKVAEEFYEQNLMDLIVEDYIERNKDLVTEKVDYLIMSVGTSYEPLVLNIKLFRPKRILFLYTEKSEVVLDKIVAHCGLVSSAFEKKRVDESNPLTIYKEIKSSFLEWNRPDKIYIDFTGGTKAMSASAAMAGALVDVQLIYVGTDHYLTDFRKPEPGTEILLFIDNPITVFGDLEIEKAMILFEEHNYAGAREKLFYLKESVPEPEIRQQLSFACLLAEAYEAWDALDFQPAYEKMSLLNNSLRRDARTHGQFLLMDYRTRLKVQGEILRNLSGIQEMVKDKQQPTLLRNKETMADLMFTMWQNAKIREEQEKYDMAALLMYRLLEMIEQRRLIRYNLYASKMEYSQIDFAKVNLRGEKNLDLIKTNMNNIRERIFGKQNSMYLPEQITLLDGFMLLLAMGDGIALEPDGNHLNFIRRTRSCISGIRTILLLWENLRMKWSVSPRRWRYALKHWACM